MASSTPNTIVLKGNGVRKERLAGGTITPGHLVLINTSDQVVVHPNAAQNARKMFAVENDIEGEGIDDNYTSGDTVQFETFQPGDEVYALVAALATAVTIGAALESAGDGTLRIQTADAASDQTQRDAVVAYAKEAVDNSGGSSVARIKVEVA